jgi:hypothetical protein
MCKCVQHDKLGNSGDHVTFIYKQCSFYALPFANDTTDDHSSDIPEITKPSNVDDEGRSRDGIDVESNEFDCLF